MGDDELIFVRDQGKGGEAASQAVDTVGGHAGALTEVPSPESLDAKGLISAKSVAPAAEL